ncbi:hypothetical protein SLEP1_g57309 [Rubroshorea leprosula]|uniref:Uncharacterized protein n=1 Tax=Rubroshorea leprosula TaxID=152421 RepID=A0AAV5MMG5_9ROSI|nr:hypothetical protein SLEP1_g57309 [Rubroshorea leprosula]
MAEKESEYDGTSDSNQSAISLSNSKISRRTLAPPPTPPLVVLKSPALASSSMTLPSTSKSFFSLNSSTKFGDLYAAASTRAVRL